MSVQLKPLFEPVQLLTTTGSPLYTSTSLRTRIDRLYAYNTDTAVRTITAYWVAAGGSVATGNEVTLTLQAGQGGDIPGLAGQVLNTGDALYIKADAAAVVNCFGSGTAGV